MTFASAFALFLTLAMIVVAVLTWFYHDTKHRDLESWIQYGFSVDTLRHAILYYRSMGISMLIFYVLFTMSLLFLQSEGHQLFEYRDGEPVSAGPLGAAMFSLDLVLRGGFFDVMEHFDLSSSPIVMDRDKGWFVVYCFVFRIYYALTLMRILVSFVWIWARIRTARRDYGLAQPRRTTRWKGRGFRLRSRQRSTDKA